MSERHETVGRQEEHMHEMQTRFETWFDKKEGCWLWDGGKTHNGYGQFYANRTNNRAHRVAYELYVGSIPAGLNVLHTCDVPACVNPAHLYLGTQIKNVADMITRGRRTKTASSGEQHVRHKR